MSKMYIGDNMVREVLEKMQTAEDVARRMIKTLLYHTLLDKEMLVLHANKSELLY